MINMGLYKVELFAKDSDTPYESHPETFEDFADATIVAEEFMQKHPQVTAKVRMITEDEEAELNAAPAGVSGGIQPAPVAEPLFIVAPIVKAIQDALGTAETGDALVEVARNAHRAEMELASPVPDCDADKSDFLAVDHRLHAVFYLVCRLPGATRKELRKRLGVESVDDELAELINLDVIRVTGDGKRRYSASAVSWLRP